MTGRNRMHRSILSALVMVFAAASPAVAERPMSTDRPDRTESPYTVPAEYFQLEMDFATYSGWSVGGIDYKILTVAPFNVKYGFTRNVDVQILFTPWFRNSYDTDMGDVSESDTGPMSIRFKINLSGNDNGATALALLPYVTAPTNGNPNGDRTVFGLAIPVTFPLANDRAIGLMAGYEQMRDDDYKSPYASATFSTPLTERLSTFLEVYYAVADIASSEDNVTIATLDTGLVFARNDNMAFDAGVYIGLTDDAEDWRVFAGMSLRTN